ncbi:MAG: hypothetical protein AMXMBFR36_04790 [Acidobacteriota bacterium]
MRKRCRPTVILAFLGFSLTPAGAQVPGTLDGSFGTGGLRRVDIQVGGAPRSNNATGLMVQLDGKIVLGGAAATDGSGAQRMVAVRLTAGGALDTSFSGDGVVAIDGYPPDDGNPRFSEGRVATAPNGGVYLYNGVVESTGFVSGWSVARLNASGGLVGTFGTAGLVHQVDLEIGVGDLVSRADGRPLILYPFLDEGGTVPNEEWALQRFLTDGSGDASFGDQGWVGFGFDVAGVQDDWAYALVLQNDGRPVAAGSADVGEPDITVDDDFAVARLTTSGALDGSFSGNGQVTIGFGDEAETARAVAVDAKKRILVGGVSAGNCALARLLPNGALDPSFSGDGKLTFSFASDAGAAFDQIFGLVPQGDGKVIVVGRATTTAGTGRRVGVARLNADGSFDSTFSSLAGRPGRQIFDWATDTGAVSVGRAVALALDGRILVSGGAERAPGDMDFVAARLHNDYVFSDGFDWGGFGSWSAHVD